MGVGKEETQSWVGKEEGADNYDQNALWEILKEWLLELNDNKKKIGDLNNTGHEKKLKVYEGII